MNQEVFELGDPVKLVGRDNPYAGKKGIFIGYRRRDWQETKIMVRMEGETVIGREYAFSQTEVELDK